MSDVRHAINDLLLETYHTLLDIEQVALEGTRLSNLTVSEIHILEAIGMEELTMGELSRRGRVSTATMTANIDKLVENGYCTRRRGEADRRRVLVSLTRAGQKAVRLHRLFHMRMVKASVEGLNEEDERVLVHALTKLRAFVLENSVPKNAEARL